MMMYLKTIVLYKAEFLNLLTPNPDQSMKFDIDFKRERLLRDPIWEDPATQ